MKRRFLIIAAFVALLLWMIFGVAYLTEAKQMQPDAKRIRQIQARLVEHGYPATMTWAQAQEVCRQIAQEHGWQTKRTPDARVLILLGLGNEHSDSDILTWKTNYLDYKKTKDPEEEK